MRIAAIMLWWVVLVQAKPADSWEKGAKLREEADIEILYHPGSEEVTLGIRQQGRLARFDLDGLVPFFDRQRHKGLVVIIVAKNILRKHELRQQVTLLKHYFVARGYERIVIQQATGGGAIPELLDHRVVAPGDE